MFTKKFSSLTAEFIYANQTWKYKIDYLLSDSYSFLSNKAHHFIWFCETRRLTSSEWEQENEHRNSLFNNSRIVAPLTFLNTHFLMIFIYLDDIQRLYSLTVWIYSCHHAESVRRFSYFENSFNTGIKLNLNKCGVYSNVTKYACTGQISCLLLTSVESARPSWIKNLNKNQQWSDSALISPRQIRYCEEDIAINPSLRQYFGVYQANGCKMINKTIQPTKN